MEKLFVHPNTLEDQSSKSPFLNKGDLYNFCISLKLSNIFYDSYGNIALNTTSLNIM